MFVRIARDALLFYARSWWRLVIVQLFTGILLAAALWLVSELAIALVGNPGSILVVGGQLSSGRLVLYVALALLLCILVCVPVTLAGAAAIVRVVDNTLSKRPARLMHSFLAGFPRSPAMLVSAIPAVLVLLALLIGSPLLSALGVIGLLLGIVVRLVRRRRPAFAPWWPSVRQLGWLAVPFALAMRWTATTMFFIPASSLHDLGIVEALRVGTTIAAGRRGRVVLAVVGSLVASLLVQAGITFLGYLVGATEGAFIAETFGQLLLVSLPIVVLTVLFRLGMATPVGSIPPSSPTVAYPVGEPRIARKPRRVPVPVSIRRTAMLMPVVLVLATLALPVASAQAATGTALTVTSAADDTGTADVAQEEQNCQQAAGTCTLRAALGEAAALSESGTSGPITVAFAGDYTVKVAAADPLIFDNVVSVGDAPSGTTGTLVIDGSGHNIVIDGQNASQTLILRSHSWSFAVRNLQISNASAALPGSDLGGGLMMYGAGTDIVDSVTFDHDFAAGGGGGLYSVGTSVITNSTFYDDSVGSANDSAVNGGAALYNSGTMAVNNSTFVGSQGGTLFNFGSAGYAMVLDNSLFDDAGSAACTGTGITGTNNVVSHADVTCPGTVANSGPSVGSFARVATDTPFVLPLIAGTPGNPVNAAFGAGGIAGGQTCTALDERGATRPSTGCDVGAVEYNAATRVTLTSSVNPSISGGSTTFVATVKMADGVTPVTSGAVQFSVDQTAVAAPVTVGSDGTSSITLSDLAIGSHDVTAAFVSVDPASFGNGDTAAPLVQRVISSTTTVAVVPSKTTATTGSLLEFVVTVGVPHGTPSGTVTLTDATNSPATVIQANVPLSVAGTVTIDGSDLSVGQHTIVASYSGDGQNVAATSPSIAVTLYAPSNLTVSVDHVSVAFGAPVTVTVTVPSSYNSIVPTGHVILTTQDSSGTSTQRINLDPSGTVSETYTNLAPGNSMIGVDYSGDQTYADSGQQNTSVTVTPASTTTDLMVSPTGSMVFGRPVTLTATVTNTDASSTALPVNSAGMVTFASNGTTIGTAPLVDAGGKTATATFVTMPSNLPVGSDAITASYSATDPNSLESSVSGASTVVVTQASTSTTLDSDLNPAPYGHAVTLTATIAAQGASQALPTGSVVFSSAAGSLGSATIVGTTATLVLADLPTGLSSIVATYAGSTSFAGSASATLDQDVRASSVTTTLDITPAAGAKVGDTLTLKVAVTPDESGGIAPGGSVRVTDGMDLLATIPLSGGIGSTTIAAPHAGAHHYVATYFASTPSNLYYNASSGSTDYTIGADDTTTSLRFSVPQSVFGDPVTLVANVANTTEGTVSPTGTVAFSYSGIQLGTAPVVDGVATLTLGLPQSSAYLDDQLPVRAAFTSSGDFNPSAADEKIVVLEATTTVSLAIDGTTFGLPSTLTEAVAVATGAGTPTGTVNFYSNGGLLGTSAVGADGTAQLTGQNLAAGNNLLLAQYVSGDADFLAPGPTSFVVNVAKGTTKVTLTTTAGGPTTFGDSVLFVATVDTFATEHSLPGVAPTGTVTFTASGPGGDVVIGAQSLSDVPPYRAVLSTGAVPAGDQTVTATYSGDGDYASSASDGITQTVHAAATTTTATVTPMASGPSYVGEEATLTAHVSNSSSTPIPLKSASIPTGYVEFSEDGTSLGSALVDSTGSASVVATLSTAGAVDIVATYHADSDFVGSSGDATQAVLVRPTSVVLSQLPAPGAVGLGQLTTFKALVTEASGTPGATSTAPSGNVPITDDAGDNCSAILVPTGAAGQSEGTCAMPLGTLGVRNITGSYVGDADFGSSTAARIQVAVEPSTPTLSLSSTPSIWVAGESITLNWSVTGPTTADATVTVAANGVPICTSMALTGDCPFAIGSGITSDTFTVTYGGDAGWTSASQSLSNPVTECILYDATAITPAAGGSVTATPAPNCDAGSGYLEGTRVVFQETPASGYSFSGWNGTTDKSAFHSVVATSGAVVGNLATFDAVCVPVEIGAFDSDLPGVVAVNPSVQPNCGSSPGWTYLGNDVNGSRVGQYLAGTKVTLSADVLTNIILPAQAPQTFYSWNGASVDAAKTRQQTQTFTVQSGANYRYFATFGVLCYHDVTFPTPVGGTATIAGTNCADPSGPGYAAGSSIGVSTHSTGTAYFVGWAGTVNPVTATISSATAVVPIVSDHIRVVAQYKDCVSFAVGESGANTVGTGVNVTEVPLASVSLSPAGSCPNKGSGWYAPGTRVTLDYGLNFNQVAFNGWSGGIVPDAQKMVKNPTFGLYSSGTATGGFYLSSVCVPINIGGYPAGAVTVSSSLPQYDPSWNCPQGMTNKNVPQELDLSATAVQGNPIIRWVGSTYRLLPGGDQTTLPLASGAAETSVEMYGYATYAAYACEEVDPTLTLIWPDGTRHTTPVPAGTDFLDATPAPDCPYGTDTYLIGQLAFPRAAGESPGYTFKGFTGAITSTSKYPTTPLVLNGAQKSVALDAAYQVNCFTLTTNYTEGVAVAPAPNCPGTDPGEHKYIGGTTVTLQALGDSGTNFDGFTGSFDGQSDVYAWTTMGADESIYADYQTKGTGQVIEEGLSTVGNDIAIAGKKVVGVAAAAIGGFLIGENPLTAAAGLAVLLGQAVGAIAGALGVSSPGLTNFMTGIDLISQTLAWMSSAATCVTVWSSAGNSDSASTGPSDLAGQTGAVIANAKVLSHQEATDAADEALQNETAAMAEAAETTALVGPIKDTLPSSATDRALAAISSTKTAAAEAAAGPIKVAGRLGVAGLVGYSIYQEISGGTGSGWDSSATAAWTQGGDIINNCLASATPAYLGLPPTTH